MFFPARNLHLSGIFHGYVSHNQMVIKDGRLGNQRKIMASMGNDHTFFPYREIFRPATAMFDCGRVNVARTLCLSLASKFWTCWPCISLISMTSPMVSTLMGENKFQSLPWWIATSERRWLSWALDVFLRLAWCMSPCWKHLQSCLDIRSRRPGNFKDMGMGQHEFDSTHQPTRRKWMELILFHFWGGS